MILDNVACFTVTTLMQLMDTDLHRIIQSPQPLGDAHYKHILFQVRASVTVKVVDVCILKCLADFEGSAVCPFLRHHPPRPQTSELAHIQKL